MPEIREYFIKDGKPSTEVRQQFIGNGRAVGDTGRLDVERYTRGVVDSYRMNTRHLDHDTASATTIYAASAIAADEGRARVDDAAKLARTAISEYAKQANAGVSHEQARDKVVREMSGRFDDRGRDTQRHERSRDGLSL